MFVTAAIRRFLSDRLAGHPGRDLVERYLAFGPEANETQVNVRPANGEKVEGKSQTWTNGTITWFNIRVPHNANMEPEWTDYEMR
jgi:hypothetical protein